MTDDDTPTRERDDCTESQVIREKWQRDANKAHAEARVDLVEALASYPRHVQMFVISEYLRKLTREHSSEEFEARERDND
jgi:hypothetical protein